MAYTPAQIRAWLGAVERAKKEALREQLWLLRLAQAEEKPFMKAWRELGGKD